MTDQQKRLEREKGTVRPRSDRSSERDRGERRLAPDERSRDARDADERDEEEQSRGPARRRRRRWQGRPPVTDELADLNRGGAYVAAESVALTLDVMSRVLRNVVDRAFDEDYTEPGDVLRGLSNEADLAVYDIVDELRRVPRRLDRRFDEGIRSPRADRGERARREHD